MAAEAKGKRVPKFLGGYSESLWKSLVVKSLRLGWPEGLRRAAGVLNERTVKSLLTCSVFEDIFPAKSELADVLDEIDRLDYEALCVRETHHGRAYTEDFCSLAEEGMEAAKTQASELRAFGSTLGLSHLPPRSLNCFYEWVKLNPMDAGKRREIDSREWSGMPLAMADAHTYEGLRKGQSVTVLSGHFENHETLGRRVGSEGWSKIRKEVHDRYVFLHDLGCLEFDANLRERWKRGELHPVWASEFPSLFDDDDLRLAKGQGVEYGSHFIEWLGAAVLHLATGFHALVGKYEFPAKHPKKGEVVKSLPIPETVREILEDRAKGSQCPDLLMYAPDLSDWFFCEIKGPGDHLRTNQLLVFERLAAASGKPVFLLKLKITSGLALDLTQLARIIEPGLTAAGHQANR